jgi:hypothetical protein
MGVFFKKILLTRIPACTEMMLLGYLGWSVKTTDDYTISILKTGVLSADYAD